MLPPRIWGLIPRLAARLSIEHINAIFVQEAGDGFTVSAELLEVESTGFKGEPGNFISRSAHQTPFHKPWRLPWRDTIPAAELHCSAKYWHLLPRHKRSSLICTSRPVLSQHSLCVNAPTFCCLEYSVDGAQVEARPSCGKTHLHGH